MTRPLIRTDVRVINLIPTPLVPNTKLIKIVDFNHKNKIIPPISWPGPCKHRASLYCIYIIRIEINEASQKRHDKDVTLTDLCHFRETKNYF